MIGILAQGVVGALVTVVVLGSARVESSSALGGSLMIVICCAGSDSVVLISTGVGEVGPVGRADDELGRFLQPGLYLTVMGDRMDHAPGCMKSEHCYIWVECLLLVKQETMYRQFLSFQASTHTYTHHIHTPVPRHPCVCWWVVK